MVSLYYITLIVILYTFLGYPALIWLLAYLKPKPINKNEYVPELTIVFSVFNEEHNIKTKIENCLSIDYPRERLSIIVVSDGSTDNTCKILEHYSKKSDNFTFLDIPNQRGKAACINDGISNVKTEFVVLTDVRQEFNNIAFLALMSNFNDTEVGAVGGELRFKNENINEFSKGVDLYWHYEKFIRKNESCFNSSVGVSGAIYAIRTKLYQNIPENTILDDVLVPMNIVRQNYRVVFESKAVAYDIPSIDKQREKNRKTRTIAGNYQIIQLAPFLLNPFENKIFIQYLSHKVLRLVMPLFLLLLFVSNALIVFDNMFYKLSMFGQLVFYILPLLNKLTTLPNKFSKPVNTINAFLSLNYFSILGFFEFFNNKNIHIWK